MNKYKSDIAESAANMMQIPDTLEGLLQDIHGQKEVESPVAENTNLALPETLTIVKKKIQKAEAREGKGCPCWLDSFD